MHLLKETKQKTGFLILRSNTENNKFIQLIVILIYLLKVRSHLKTKINQINESIIG